VSASTPPNNPERHIPLDGVDAIVSCEKVEKRVPKAGNCGARRPVHRRLAPSRPELVSLGMVAADLMHNIC
jgi:hypothetical protein